MTRERWEVTAVNPENGEEADVITYERHEAALTRARVLRRAGWVPRVVHVRTYRVEVVYAWRYATVNAPLGARWLSFDLQTWTGMKPHRAEFRDPIGKHSRRRAKRAALAAKPSGPCVLVAVRRRVRG